MSVDSAQLLFQTGLLIDEPGISIFMKSVAFTVKSQQLYQGKRSGVCYCHDCTASKILNDLEMNVSTNVLEKIYYIITVTL